MPLDFLISFPINVKSKNSLGTIKKLLLFVTEGDWGSVLLCLKPKSVVAESDESHRIEELVCLCKTNIKS